LLLIVRQILYLYKGGLTLEYLNNLTLEEFFEEVEILNKIQKIENGTT